MSVQRMPQSEAKNKSDATNGSTTSATEIVREFEGVALRVRLFRGRRWVEARNLGEVLGFKDRRDALQLIDRYAEDFVEGIDAVKLTGADLAEWKADYPATSGDPDGDMSSTRGHVDRAARIVLLSEIAARTVAMLARTPKARAVRRWLANVWAEIDRTGRYEVRGRVKALQAENANLRAELHTVSLMGAMGARLSSAAGPIVLDRVRRIAEVATGERWPANRRTRLTRRLRSTRASIEGEIRDAVGWHRKKWQNFPTTRTGELIEAIESTERRVRRDKRDKAPPAAPLPGVR